VSIKPGAIINGQLRLIEPLAEGGMGSVWVADHLGLDARVAVKFLSAELAARDPTLLQRLKSEASICARLRSVHVVQTFDHGMTDSGEAYIVMELLDGSDLGWLVQESGTMPLKQLAVVVSQVAGVLERAHELGIVHRDIKPDNIFLIDSEYEVFVKLLDFGIAKLQRSADRTTSFTREGAIIGTLEFMSPEQSRGSAEVDHRADLFSLGVVCYWALTGALPFSMDHPSPLWRQSQQGPPAITERDPRLPDALDGWFARALSADVQARFQSAREMSRALDKIASNYSDGDTLRVGSQVGTEDEDDGPPTMPFHGDRRET
jgi:serine/threonine-protein kinase